MAQTLEEGITKVLRRVKLSTSSATYQDRARDYMSDIVAELLPFIPAQSLDRSTTFRTTLKFTISGASGSFTVGETITGGTSGKTATVSSHASTLLYVYSESGDFTASETITGGTSGVTATYSSAAFTRTYTPISGPVTAWWSATNETQDRPIAIIGPDDYDYSDPDRDLDQNATAILAAGVDSTTGYPILEVWPAEATTGDVIRLRYRIDIARWTSANDASTFQVLGLTRPMESAVVYGATALMAEEERNYGLSKIESDNASRAMEAVRRHSLLMQGNRRHPPHRSGGDIDGDGVTMVVGSDIVSAA